MKNATFTLTRNNCVEMIRWIKQFVKFHDKSKDGRYTEGVMLFNKDFAVTIRLDKGEQCKLPQKKSQKS